MNISKIFQLLILVTLVIGFVSCKETYEPFDDEGNGVTVDDGDAPAFDPTIYEWDGRTANDAHLDAIGSDADFYHENNAFTNVITITYNDNEVSIECDNEEILTHTDGAYVTLDMKTLAVPGVEIILKGKSENGGLKIYGENMFKLVLDNIDLTSKKGPAINNQCKKRMFVHLNDGTTNRLTDASVYTEDAYYLDATLVEDRKGCFFSESNMIFSGTGVLVVSGKYRHGIVTDGYFWMRPGVTIVVTEAAKNGIHAKGNVNDQIGVYVKGGLIYTNISSIAGKGIKTDLDAEITGGELRLNTSGDAGYDADENDTSSAAAINSGGSIIISGGTHSLKSTGSGGKGLNAKGRISISNGETTITTSGNKYVYSDLLTSSPKGAKADGNITIGGGKLNISVTGESDGSEGLESKASMTISGGEVFVHAYADAIKATSTFNVSGGKVYSYSSNNDGIDSNGSVLISGGIVIASGASNGIDCEISDQLKINGGIVIASGGTMKAAPSSSSSQRCVAYNGLSIEKGAKISILDASSKPILTYGLHRSMSNASLLLSSPNIIANKSYTISANGTLSNYTDSWNGYYEGGTWSGGNNLTTFTTSSVVTTIGN